VVSPIICDGDVIGGVVFLSPESGQQLSEVELKLAQSASDFLGRHMEG
jgi:AbrB family transcriptional regulator (stage V sporulation protein T)